MTLEERIHELENRFGDLLQKPVKSASEMQEKERIREALTAALRQQEKPLLDELSEVGLDVESVWDLVNTSASYGEGVHILVKHLAKPYHRRNKVGIVRALAVKEAKGIASDAIISEYKRTPQEDDGFRWTFGNTMRVIATEQDLDALVQIVLDESNGDSRQMFVVALAKLKSAKVDNVLERLLSDRSTIIASEAEKALKRRARARSRT
jgi:hypothetical protein